MSPSNKKCRRPKKKKLKKRRNEKDNIFLIIHFKVECQKWKCVCCRSNRVARAIVQRLINTNAHRSHLAIRHHYLFALTALYLCTLDASAVHTGCVKSRPSTDRIYIRFNAFQTKIHRDEYMLVDGFRLRLMVFICFFLRSGILISHLALGIYVRFIK